MSAFDYYVETRGTPSLRRYPKGENIGQRWDKDKWTPQCTPREACVKTGDTVVPESEAGQLFPGCLESEAAS